MKKLWKMFFRHWPSIIMVILLTFLQVYCELILPEYTSNIVNVGIQQNGIDSGVPTAIRESEMYLLKTFMSEDDIKLIDENYYFTDEYNESALKLKNLDKYEKSYKEEILFEIEEALEIPMVASFLMANMSEESDLSLDFSALTAEMDISELPEGVTPDLSDPAFLAMAKEELNKIDSSYLDQISIAYISNEYRVLGVDIDKIQRNYMYSVGGYMAFYAFVALVTNVVASLLVTRVGSQLARDIRSRVFSKIMSFSNSEFDSFSTASLITRSTNDVQQVQMLVNIALRMMLFSPMMGISSFLKVLNQGYSLSWILGLALAIILILIVTLMIVAMPKFQKIQNIIDKLNLIAREILTGLPVIRAFSREEKEKERFDGANTDLMKINLFVNRAMTLLMPAMMFIMNGVSVLIIWMGGKQIDVGTMQVGDLIAFISYAMHVIMSFLFLAMMFIMIPRAFISAKRIGEVLDKEVSIKEDENPQKFDESMKGVIEFRNVSFRYENAEEDVLENISFVSKRGETTAIIGSTGSGKSTLANLIPRFFDVTDGEILINGTDIRKVSLHDLRDKIGYVPQKAILFSGTIKSNIMYSDENMSEEIMELAAEISQATDFIMSKPKTFESGISQGGTNVSGGQKQRLSIARAIAKNPEIYIFDDSFSALDYKTDTKLRRALSSYTKDSTVLIIAQRISTVLTADQILVLEDGKIVGKGTHKELLKSCEVYRDIAYSQLSADELSGKEDA